MGVPSLELRAISWKKEKKQTQEKKTNQNKIRRKKELKKQKIFFVPITVDENEIKRSSAEREGNRRLVGEGRLQSLTKDKVFSHNGGSLSLRNCCVGEPRTAGSAVGRDRGTQGQSHPLGAAKPLNPVVRTSIPTRGDALGQGGGAGWGGHNQTSSRPREGDAGLRFPPGCGGDLPHGPR